jgi:phosphoribosylaminoimidazolecarboxamide formyltransferase/IMP cyclohydrolase
MTAATSSPQEIRKIYRTPTQEKFPSTLKLVLGNRTIEFSKVQWTVNGQKHGLRYGTNPHQQAALYANNETKAGMAKVEWVKWGKNGPSATNIEDGSHGLRIVRYFEETAVAVMKHLNPSGVAVGSRGEMLHEIYARARDVDPRAAFGSVIVTNQAIDRSTAEEIMKSFVEIVYAPEFDSSAVKLFETRKDIRLGKILASTDETAIKTEIQIPELILLDNGSLILEEAYDTSIRSLNDLKNLPVSTVKKPTADEYASMLRAWHTVCETRSNGIVFWKNNASLAIGTGQQDRIGAIETCINKAQRYNHNLQGSIMASDGFLPKIDNVEIVAEHGISGIIQPGGSVEDADLVKACDKYGMSMVLTGERAFRHF